MGTIELSALENVGMLVNEVHRTDEPIVVLDGDDECLIAMRPAVLERILFDCDLLNSVNRPMLRL